jgi:hypothetical protein
MNNLKSNFSKINLSTLNINKAYSINSKDISIQYDDKNILLDMHHLNAIRDISNLDKIKSLIEYFYNFSTTLNLSEADDLNWNYLLGKSYTKEYVNYLNREIEYTLKMITGYHVYVYKDIKEVQNIKTCVILNDKKLELPVYKNNTVTGRSKIINGFNFLTLKKELKKQLKSNNKNEVLVEVDLKSCEPNFYLKAIGCEIKNKDVYSDICNKLNIKMKDRARFKRGILSILYGAAKKTSKNMLQVNNNDIDKINEYFKKDLIVNELRREYDKHGLMYNFYGRPICSDSNLLNYWIQSSAADYCYLAFKNLSEQFNLKPCFFVHDSMVFSINKEELGDILKIEYVTEKRSNFKIPVEFNIIG